MYDERLKSRYKFVRWRHRNLDKVNWKLKVLGIYSLENGWSDGGIAKAISA